jgi:hypothetical protein
MVAAGTTAGRAPLVGHVDVAPVGAFLDAEFGVKGDPGHAGVRIVKEVAAAGGTVANIEQEAGVYSVEFVFKGADGAFFFDHRHAVACGYRHDIHGLVKAETGKRNRGL